MMLSPVFTAKASRVGKVARSLGIRIRGLALSTVAVLLTTSTAFAATYYVDAANPSATDGGSGSVSVPYKTIQAAVTARATAGNTIIVKPSVYRETVTFPAAGSSGSRIVLQSSAPGVIINGSDDFSGVNKWVNIAGNVYLASSVNWVPGQVFKNGARLASSASAPSSLPSNSYRYVAGIGLYVNVGGGNPGSQTLEVGRRANGLVIGQSYITIDGVKVTQTDDKAVSIPPSPTGVIVQNCTVTFANKFGIQVDGGTSVSLIKNVVGDNNDHGIFVTGGSTSCIVRGNESYGNARPSARAANGININASPSCTVENNRCHDNQDSGIQFYNGSNNGISRNNVSYENGDHGYDHIASTGVKHFNDIAYLNFKDGFSIEGSSSGCTMMNCIAVDNGLTANEVNLWVDAASLTGFVSDYNVIWNSVAGVDPIKINTTKYASLAAYRSAFPSLDSHSKQVDPKWIFPASSNFRPMAGSPLVDAGIGGQSGWSSTDHDGLARQDVSGVSNTGSGSPSFSDIGAYEYRPAGAVPVASLVLNPTRGITPLSVLANGSGSNDPDGSIAAYWFNFGDGFSVGPQASPTSTHIYSAGGTYTASLTVVDNLGQATVASKIDTVIQGDRPPVVVVNPVTFSLDEGQVVQVIVSVSDPDGNPITSLSADLSLLPPGHNATFVNNGANTSGTLTWTPVSGMSNVVPYDITFTASNALSGSTTSSITVTKPNLLPNAALSVTPRSGNAPLLVTANASASSDPDGSSVSYQFDFGDGTIVGPQASSSATHTYAVGTWPVQVIATDNRGGSSISPSITVQALGTGANMVANPSFETNLTGWSPTPSSGTTAANDTLVMGGQIGMKSVLSRGAATGTVMFGINDSPNVVTNSGPLGTLFHFEAWVRSDVHHGVARIRLREFSSANASLGTSYSNSVTLSTTWQKLSIDYTPIGANSSIDFNVLDTPIVAGEKFNIDNIIVQQLAVSNPIVNGPASVSGAEVSPISFVVTASDPDGQPIDSFVADMSALPAGHNAAFVPNGTKTSGTFTWTPTQNDARAAAYNVTFIATNAGGGGSTIVPVLVSNVDRAPTVSAAATTSVTETQLLTFSITAADLDGDLISSLTADLSNLPVGNNAVFTPNATKTAGTLTWTPTVDDGPSSYNVVFTATNALSGTATTAVTVNQFDQTPIVAAPSSVDVQEGQLLSLDVSAADPDGQPITSLTANLTGLPFGHSATFTPNGTNTGGTLAWTPTYADSGAYTVTFTGANTLSGNASTSIHVTDVNRNPIVSVASTATVNENALLSLPVTVSEPEGETIVSLTSSTLPVGAVFTPNGTNTGGSLVWTPSYADSGSYSMTFTATSSTSGAGTAVIKVVNIDRAPVVTAPVSVNIGENQPLTVSITVADPDGDAITTLTPNLNGLPAGNNASFTPGANNLSGTLTWTPLTNDGLNSPYTVNFLAANALSASAATSINVDRRPVVNVGASFSTNEGQQVSIPVTASDPDGQAITSLTANFSNLPAGHNAAFVPNGTNTGGTLTWTPSFNDAPSAYSITITATNVLSGSGTTSVSVSNVDRAPAVTAAATASAPESAPFTLVITAADPDGDAITSLMADFSALPAGNNASFIANGTKTAGTLSWTPNPADTGPYAVTFTAANTLTGAVSTTQITVDHHPVVTALTNASVNENQQLSIGVIATDPDGAAITALTANLSALPVGHNAVFTANAELTGGTLTWTPTYNDAPGPYVVRFIASNTLTDSASTSVAVVNVDRAPVVVAAATKLIAESAELSFDIAASDPDGDVITTLSADFAALPGGHNAVFTPNGTNTAGTLTWTPTPSEAPGPYSIIFTATNALAGTATTVVTIDRHPVVAVLTNVSIDENQQLTVGVTASDPDGTPINSLIADLSGLPAGNASFVPAGNNSGGTLTWTPNFNNAPGPYLVTFTAVSGAPALGAVLVGHETNVSGLSTSVTTTITVNNIDRIPVVTAQPTALVAEGTQLSFGITASDPDGDAITSLSLDSSGLPGGHNAVLTPAGNNLTATFTWTPQAGDGLNSPYTVTFAAHNALSSTNKNTVITVDRAPVVSAAATTSVTENQQLSFAITAADPDAGQPIVSLTANLTGLPAGHNAVFTPNASKTAGTLVWTPTFADAPGPYTVSFAATNTLSGSASTQITVNNSDRAPVVSVPALSPARVGTQLSVTVSASDPDGDAIATLSANLTGLPAGHNAVFTPNGTNTGGTLTWTPLLSEAPGPYSITFTAANALSGSGSTSVTINRPPVVTAAARTSINENLQLNFAITAADPDNDAISSLTADLSALPGLNKSFTPNGTNTGGTLTFTPPYTAAPGPYSVTFTAVSGSPSQNGAASTSITVGNVDRAPLVTAPATVTTGPSAPLSMHVSVADPDGDGITSLIADFSSLPAGNAAFVADGGNTGGTLTWTPQPGDAHGPFTVSFTATNALTGSASTSVTNDRAPVVTVAATATVNENQQLSLPVTASDPDGDAINSLTATLTGLPAGHNAAFTPNGSNTGGTLTWTPTYADGSITPYSVSFTATNSQPGSASSAITVVNVDRAPVVTVAPATGGNEATLISFTVTASDPDGDVITSFTPTLTSLPVGHNATFVPNGSNTSGSFNWTPAVGNGRVAAYNVSFAAANALSGSAGTAISVNPPPVAALVANPSSGNVSINAQLNAGGSTDNGSIVSYTFNFGDSSPVVGPQASAITNHTYSAGNWTATVTVTDNLGATASATAAVTVSNAPPNLVGNGEFETSITGWSSVGSAVLSRVAGGHSGNFCLEMRAPSTSSFGINDNPNWVTSIPAIGTQYRVSAWVRSAVHRGTVKLKVKEFIGTTQQGSTIYSPTLTLSATWQLLTTDFTSIRANSQLDIEVAGYPIASAEIIQVDDVSITRLNGVVDNPPVVVAPASASVNENGLLTVNVTASDAEAITSLTANVTGLPAGHNAVFTPNAAKTAGTLTWTPTFSDGRVNPYSVTFTAANALSGSGSTSITVNNIDRAPVVTAAATAAAQKNVQMSLVITAADPDGDAITTLAANLANLPAGNNAAFSVNASKTQLTLTWTPQNADGPGPYNVTFTATNALSGTATTAIAVTNPPVVTAPPTATVNENQQVSIIVNASDPDSDPITTLTANVTGLPAGHNATFVANGAKTQGTLTWTPTFSHGRVAPYTVTFTAANAASGSASTAITVTNVDRVPVVTAAATATGNEGSAISVTITAADPDSEAITSLAASFVNLPAGHNATFTPNGTNRGGTLTWTPTSADGRVAPYNVTFTATNALSGSATTAITVADAPAGGANLVTNPGFETNLTGWLKTGSATLTRVAGGRSGGFCMEVKAPSTSSYGVNDSPNWVSSVPAIGTRYRLSAWIRSSIHRGTAKLKVKEFLGSTQQGSTVYSPTITLSATWQLMTLDYVTVRSGSTLDFEVAGYPIVTGEIFQLDDVSISIVTNTAQPLAQTPADVMDQGALAFGVTMMNPVHSTGVMHFTLTQAGPVRVELYDLAGRVVSRPLDQPSMSIGRHQLSIRSGEGARQMPAGAYFYRLTATEGVKIGRFVVLE